MYATFGTNANRPKMFQKYAKSAQAQISYIPSCCLDTELGSGAPAEDIIAQTLGKFGIWQWRSVFIIFLGKIPAALLMASILFTAPDIYPNEEYTCDVSAYGGVDNCTVSSDQCYVLASVGHDQFALRRCLQFNYAHSFHSLIMEFDLVCLCDVFVAWSQYWHLFGMFLGVIVATRLMRVLSPRRIYISGLWGLLCCGVATALVNDFSLYCAFRCLTAVACSSMMTSGYTLISDITTGRERQIALLVSEIFWSIGIILLPAFAAFATSWHQIVMGITLVSVVIVLLLPWLPESPRWLLQYSESAHAVEHVHELLLRAASVNDRCSKTHKDLGMQLALLSEQLRVKKPAVRWLELWQGHRPAKLHMLATHMALACFLIGHTGLLLNIRSFGRDYMAANTMGMGLAEIVGLLVAIYLSCKQQQTYKWQWAGLFSILGGSIGCLCWFFTDAQMPEGYEILLWMFFASAPKAAVSCAQALLLASMGELMPREKRDKFAFSVQTWAHVWLLSAAFLTVLRQLSPALSLSVFCVLVICGGICTCLLRTPERDDQQEEQQQLDMEASFSSHL